MGSVGDLVMLVWERSSWCLGADRAGKWEGSQRGEAEIRE